MIMYSWYLRVGQDIVIVRLCTLIFEQSLLVAVMSHRFVKHLCTNGQQICEHYWGYEKEIWMKYINQNIWKWMGLDKYCYTASSKADIWGSYNYSRKVPLKCLRIQSVWHSEAKRFHNGYNICSMWFIWYIMRRTGTSCYYI